MSDTSLCPRVVAHDSWGYCNVSTVLLTPGNCFETWAQDSFFKKDCMLHTKDRNEALANHANLVALLQDGHNLPESTNEPD